MKRQIIILLIVFFAFCMSPAYSAVTTSDGAITFDFYEDTQSGIENRWVFEFSYDYLGKFYTAPL